MKTIFKILLAVLYLPIFALAAVIAIVRFLFEFIFVFAWDTGEEWFSGFVFAFNKFLKGLKK